MGRFPRGRDRGAAAGPAPEFRLVREPLMCRLYELGVPESMPPLRLSSRMARVGERWDRSGQAGWVSDCWLSCGDEWAAWALVSIGQGLSGEVEWQRF